ncbi:GNAT family N-acetyltransferase [Lutibacter sp. TH_r2]|uniref:GNAT family N-acetyltransferase n=1 Tax=Lutibacter sp. TH_r2 TaxID=3082083 RepID=UPI0029545788|nr:GNAT family N-acetyltransferase [Lutibacter sp. TH_r2]MDV7188522.1 GNAT family N-acetyltransferase [Lutibacter sp. TH_r2]
MTHNGFTIREIQPKDNTKIAKAIREVLIEFGVPKVGTAYADKILDTLFEAYNTKNAIYYIIEKNNEIYGGAGIKKLDNFDGAICELQKMYFKTEARGIGLGSKMMHICLEKGKQFGFKQCYLETLPYMKGARKLYRKTGFKDLDAPMGDTGHYSCNLWMLKNL